MRKGILLAILFIFGIELGSCGKEEVVSSLIETTNTIESSIQEQERDDIISYVLVVMEKTGGYVPYWNKENFKGKWNYIDGVMLSSLLTLYEKTTDTTYLNFVIKYVNYYINSTGEFVNLKNFSASGYNIQNYALDDICASRILFKLYDYTQDERYLKAINTTFSHILQQPRTSEGNFWHKKEYVNQVWLDGLYMVNPFYVQYANENPNGRINVNQTNISYYDDIYNQYINVQDKMFDKEKQLYYHGYDNTKQIFWANQTTGCSSSFWLRSMGWYIVSLVDVLEYYPQGDKKETLKDILNAAISGVMQYQDAESKMFYQVVDRGNQGMLVPAFYYPSTNQAKYVNNYLETSGSSMIAYSLMKGSRLGFLPSAYNNKGREILDGVTDKYLTMTNNTLNLEGICITAGLGPDNKRYRDGSFAYYLSEEVGSNDAKGVGPFIMAYTEYLQ